MTTNPATPWIIRRVALMSTGSEILQGQYADSNARYLAERLTLRGIQVVSIAAAPDEISAIERLVKFSAEQADLVISTGGLGPTRDDVNRFVFEKVTRRSLQRDETAVESMRHRFRTRGYGEMPAANEVQALLPEGCVPFYNHWGTAPGFLVLPTGDGPLAQCGLLALPGPPSEMIPMFENLVLPHLEPGFPQQYAGGIRTIHTYGEPESLVGSLVADLFDPQPNVEFSILAKRHGVDLRICATGESTTAVQQRLEQMAAAVRQRVPGEMIYGEDDDTVAVEVGRLLKARGAWVSTAESCTGGMVAQMLTAVDGSSAYVGECHVTYSNEAKMKILGVKKETLDAHGAVSEETAIEMAEGARKISDADYAISVTGIAGPGGGSPDKPVGLVYISVATPTKTITTRNQLLGTRSQNREQSALIALDMLRRELIKTHPTKVNVKQ